MERGIPYRGSAIGWKEMLLDLEWRGLEKISRLAVGEGVIGFWKVLREVYPHKK